MAKKKLNLTLDPKIFEEFCKYAAKYGTSISAWVEVKMQEFVEEQKEYEEFKRNKKGTK
ncbi:uracil-DNA glycosylase [Clostridium botulinum]|uniref:hypothetical protein n=1 Tax=Clostridium botulinum TaxID=1491 RepID=UPI000597D000|nr:hypothetical protein [Clostridium botulinum]KIL07460.1 uracil-DNA glycosylase [Clostridium botulinum]MBY6934516.1 hypothetical protein [Clostridium botulinum]